MTKKRKAKIVTAILAAQKCLSRDYVCREEAAKLLTAEYDAQPDDIPEAEKIEDSAGAVMVDLVRRHEQACNCECHSAEQELKERLQNI